MNTAVLNLQADLGIESMQELHGALMPHVDAADPIVLDGDAVQRVHCAGLQLLHAFVRDRAALGFVTTFSAASQVLRQAARQLALSNALGLEPPHDGDRA